MPSPRPAVPATATGIARSEGLDTVFAAHPRLLATPTTPPGCWWTAAAPMYGRGCVARKFGLASTTVFGGDAVDEVVDRQRLRVLLALINSEGSCLRRP